MGKLMCRERVYFSECWEGTMWFTDHDISQDAQTLRKRKSKITLLSHCSVLHQCISSELSWPGLRQLSGLKFSIQPRVSSSELGH